MIKRTSYNGIEEVVYTGDDVEIVRVWMFCMDEQHNRGGDMNITICDICGMRDNVHRLNLLYGSQRDAAGGQEGMYESYDLCRDHEVVVLRKSITKLLSMVDKSDHEFNAITIKTIKGMLPKKEEV